MLNLSLSYAPAGSSYNLFVRGANLLDEEVRNHSSFLANVIPMPGRNISAGVKLNF
jgi:iron complex outermembrane receptor protein